MVEEVNERLKERNEVLNVLKSHLEKAQLQMRQQADKKHRDVEFAAGDRVPLGIQSYKLKKLA